MDSPIVLRLLLAALLLAALGGCAVYDPRPVVTGNTYVDPHEQDRITAEDRLARIAIAREWNAQDRRGSEARMRRYLTN